MALNCPDRGDDGEPCGECENCTYTWSGHTALDVVEIDAASNRGVDDARDLRERAMYAPSQEGRSKIYIIDEAHMLTREAWNALLKILEEPPPRVIFIFATTEPQKIQQLAAPILSRCQRFDFRRIGVADIVTRLSSVLDAEGHGGASDDALRMLARKADGGMRDALSLLDQVLSLTGGEVDVESVRRVLGLVEDERYFELLDIVRASRHEEVFGLMQRLVDDGYDLVEFYHGLLDVLRHLLRLRLSPDADVDVQEDVRAQLLEHAGAFASGDLMRMLSAASDLESQGSLRRSPSPRLPIEMLLLRMTFFDRTVSFEELIGALGGAPPAQGGAGSAGGQTKPPAFDSDGSGAATPRRETEAAATPESEAAATPESEAAATPEPEAAATTEPRAPTTSERTSLVPTDDVQEAWTRWLDAGVGIPKGLGAFLRSATVTTSEEGHVVVEPLPGPAMERLSKKSVMDQVADGLAVHLGRPVRVVSKASDTAPAGVERVSREEVEADTLKALYRQEPRLERAVEELDLELMD